MFTEEERTKRHRESANRWYHNHNSPEENARRNVLRRNRYAQRDKERDKLRRQSKTHKLKEEVLSRYSLNGVPCCTRCGTKDLRVLSLDHINDDGYEYRKKTKLSGSSFYQWLKSNGFPPLGLQVLCMNCQWIKRYERLGF